MGMALRAVSNVEKEYEVSRDNLEEIIKYLTSMEDKDVDHHTVESQLEVKGRELLRLLLQEYLDQRGPGEVVEEVRDAEGDTRHQKRIQTRNLESIFGTVQVRRTGYGKKGAKSLHPLDAGLNLPRELFSLELQRRAAIEISKNSFEEALESINSSTGAKVAKRQMEQMAERAAKDFDLFYQNRRTSPADVFQKGSVVVITSDGKGVVMRKEDLRETTRRAAERSTRKLKTRLTKGEKSNSKRMATVASVYTVPPYVRKPEDVAGGLAPQHNPTKEPRAKIENKRVWASLEKSPEEVLQEAFEEAVHRDPTQEKNWVAVVDGNKHQLRLLKKLARRHGVDLTIVLDLIHVLEYLWKAAAAFHDETSLERENWVQERFLQILKGNSSHVAAGMRRSATRREFSTEKRKAVDTCADYLLTYKAHLKYDIYLAAGLPIATGVIEGACRHLVKDRMDLTGARWSLSGAESVLQLRALRASNDFDEYWKFHEKCEHERNHASRYYKATPPSTTKKPSGSTKKPHLKLLEK